MSGKCFDGYLLITDMDGTLLNSRKQISSENMEAIERFTAEGGRFTVATGRTVESAEPFVRQLPVNTPAILYNGAMIYDYARQEVVWHKTLPEPAKHAVVQVIEAFPGIGAEIYIQGEAVPYTLSRNEVTERHLEIEAFPYKPIQVLKEMPSTWLKVLFAWEPERLDEAAEAIVRLTDEADISWVRSDDRFFEMLPSSATKGHALEMLLTHINIPIKRCAAMGDHLNDLEMIRRAGFGFAVKNAHPELHAIANNICKHHEEHAVADVIEWLEAYLRTEQ